MLNDRKLGFFTIDINIVRHDPEEVAEVFAMLKIVPVKAEHRMDLHAIEYLAIGERFEEIPKGQLAPRYELKITKSKSGNIELIEVEKVE